MSLARSPLPFSSTYSPMRQSLSAGSNRNPTRADRFTAVARACVYECSPPAHHDFNLLEQGHGERDERHEQRGAGEGVRHERRQVRRRRAGDEVRLRQHEWLVRK